MFWWCGLAAIGTFYLTKPDDRQHVVRAIALAKRKRPSRIECVESVVDPFAMLRTKRVQSREKQDPFWGRCTVGVHYTSAATEVYRSTAIVFFRQQGFTLDDIHWSAFWWIAGCYRCRMYVRERIKNQVTSGKLNLKYARRLHLGINKTKHWENVCIFGLDTRLWIPD